MNSACNREIWKCKIASYSILTNRHHLSSVIIFGGIRAVAERDTRRTAQL